MQPSAVMQHKMSVLNSNVCKLYICVCVEKAMATHSSTLAWKIPWMEEPSRLQSMGSLRLSDTTERLHFHFSLSCIGEGNGNPLQCSCLENPRDGRAWWASVYGGSHKSDHVIFLFQSLWWLFIIRVFPVICQAFTSLLLKVCGPQTSASPQVVTKLRVKV